MAEITTTRDVLAHAPPHLVEKPDPSPGGWQWEPRNPIALALAWFDPRVVAVSVGVTDTTELVDRLPLSSDEADEQDPVMRKAWTLVEATRVLLSAADTPRIAEAWWIGTNAQLGDNAPMLVLADHGEAGRQAVIIAAREYAVTG